MKKYGVLVLLTALITNLSNAIGQTVQSYPSAASSPNAANIFQINWVSSNKVFADDNVSASSQFRIQTELEYTTLLTVTGFDFSAVPNDAVIKGIELKIKRRSFDGGSLIDRVVRLTTSPTTLNYSKTTNWSNTYGVVSYGGTTDSWGTTLTPNQIKDPNFGVLFQVGRSTITGSSNQYPEVDFFQISVTYVTPLPVELISFKGLSTKNKTIDLTWQTATETNSSHYLIERSLDGEEFEQVGKIEAAGNSYSLKNYLFTDRLDEKVSVLYYRLVQIDQDGAFKIYGPISVLSEEGSRLVAFPNPSSGIVHIRSNIDQINSYVVSDLNGKILFQESLGFGSSSFDLNLTSLQDGLYHVSLLNSNGSMEDLKIQKH